MRASRSSGRTRRILSAFGSGRPTNVHSNRAPSRDDLAAGRPARGALRAQAGTRNSRRFPPPTRPPPPRRGGGRKGATRGRPGLPRAAVSGNLFDLRNAYCEAEPAGSFEPVSRTRSTWCRGRGSLAQLVEQRTLNPLVVGSNPTRPTTPFTTPAGVLPQVGVTLHLPARVSRQFARLRIAQPVVRVNVSRRAPARAPAGRRRSRPG